MSEKETLKDVADAAPSEPIGISIPMRSGDVVCGMVLTPTRLEDGRDAWVSTWEIEVDEGNAIDGWQASSEVDGGPYNNAIDAAMRTVAPIEQAAAAKDPENRLGILNDLDAFFNRIDAGEVPELAPPAEGDALPSVDSPLSAEDELGELRDYRACTGVLAREITKRKAVVEDRKKDLKQAKDALEEAQDALEERALEEQNGGRAMPLFEKPPPAVAPPDEQWRAIATEQMDLPDRAVKQLAFADTPIHTAGDISDWIAKLSKNGVANPLCAIAGIGKKKAEEILAALQATMAANPPGEESES